MDQVTFNGFQSVRRRILATNAKTNWQTGKTDITYTSQDRIATKANNDNDRTIISSIGKTSGKWYGEILLTVPSGISSSGLQDIFYGVAQNSDTWAGNSTSGGFGIAPDRNYFNNVSGSTGSTGLGGYSPLMTSPDSIYLMIAVDMTAKLVWLGADGTWFDGNAQGAGTGAGNPAAGTFAGLSGWTGSPTFYLSMRMLWANMVAELPTGSPNYSPPSGFTIW